MSTGVTSHKKVWFIIANRKAHSQKNGLSLLRSSYADTPLIKFRSVWKQWRPPFAKASGDFGGEYRSRTDDLLPARQAL